MMSYNSRAEVGMVGKCSSTMIYSLLHFHSFCFCLSSFSCCMYIHCLGKANLAYSYSHFMVGKPECQELETAAYISFVIRNREQWMCVTPPFTFSILYNPKIQTIVWGPHKEQIFLFLCNAIKIIASRRVQRPLSR